MRAHIEQVLQVVEGLPVQDRFMVAGGVFLVACLILEGVLQLVFFIQRKRD